MGLYSNQLVECPANTKDGFSSGKNSINFTWKLVMADIDADYVVVHEIAHIKKKSAVRILLGTLVGKYYPNCNCKECILRNYR